MSLQLPESLKIKSPSDALKVRLSGADQLARRELQEATMSLRTPVDILCKRLGNVEAALSKKGAEYDAQAEALQIDRAELLSLSKALKKAIEKHEGEEGIPDAPV